MTPLQKIKAGIESGNIALIAEGYNTLSSDKVDMDRIYTMQQARSRASNGRQTNFAPEAYSTPTDYEVYQQKQNKVACRAEAFQIKKRINMWADDKTDRLPDYTEADKANDEKFRNAQRAPRRRPYKPVQVNCYSCGHRYNVNPAIIIQGNYRCDDCNSR